MNPTTLSYSVFLFFIAIAAASEDVVYDIAGKKVLNDASYSIGPVIWAKGGGIKLTNTKNNKKVCPLYVVQDPAEVNQGGHFIFTLIDQSRPKYLLTSRNLGIDSGPPTGSCNKTTFWQIPDAEAKAPSNLISTGGRFETDTTCFQIVDYPKPTSSKVHSYMLQHCPSFCGAGPPICFNVSLYADKGLTHLGSRGTPFEFVFKKIK